ncbi:MAG: DUF4864 domain-containing protein [Betaproteobacteria bacterium]
MKILRRGGVRILAVFLLFALMPALNAATSQPLAGSAGAETLSTADRQKIQRVIALQIRAFERNDEAVAFSYSTPETRKYFGSSRTFMDMVRDNYSVLYMNTSRAFLDAAVIDGQVIQPLRIVTPGGETLVALYTLERQPDREWRIGGCELAPSNLQST